MIKKIIGVLFLVTSLAFVSCQDPVNGVDGGGGTGGSSEQPTGATTYTVTVASGISNGTVTVDKPTAKAGDVVTITATANSGYELDGSVSVKKGSENVTVTSDNKFTMPAGDVTVSASFKVSGNSGNGDEPGNEENSGSDNPGAEPTEPEQPVIETVTEVTLPFLNSISTVEVVDLTSNLGDYSEQLTTANEYEYVIFKVKKSTVDSAAKIAKTLYSDSAILESYDIENGEWINPLRTMVGEDSNYYYGVFFTKEINNLKDYYIYIAWLEGKLLKIEYTEIVQSE